MDFSHEELTEAVDRLVAGLLERAGVTAPPVDALALAENHLGIPIEWVEPEEDDDSGRRRPRPRSGAGSTIALSPEMSAEQRQRVAADGIGRLLLPEVFHKVGVAPGTENRQFAAHVRALLVARVLVPTKPLRAALRECKYDVPALHRVFRTASMEAVAARLLDLDEPCVIAVVDDGVVARRRGNRAPAARKLTAAEQECVDRVTELDLPHRARVGGWTAWAWPVPGRPFRRILLRAVPDDV
jgi:predicted transcriptional regulator